MRAARSSSRSGTTASPPRRSTSRTPRRCAALLGFFLALREHVLTTRGGIELLVLDDSQELLDNDNRERMARELATLAKEGAQILATTHDRKFAQSLVNEGRARECIAHLSVHAVNPVRPTLSASPAIEEIDRKRVEFRSNPDSAPHAQDYAGDVRVFLEARLGDLFDDRPFPTHAASTRPLTLIPLVDKLRGLVNTRGSDLLRNPVVVRFAGDPALAEGAEVRRVLNTAHHDKRSLTYMDVKSVESELGRLRTDVEAVHEQFRLFRWREPLADHHETNVVALRAATRLAFDVHVCPDIAAFAGRLPAGGSQDASADRLTGKWFEGKSLYFVRGDSLGFAIPSGAVAIVESETYPGRDQNLVVAIHRGTVFARRLVKSRAGVGVSLSAQMPDPRTRRPTVTFEESKVRLHRVVGALFTNMPPPAGGTEAALVDTVPELGRVSVAYKVREESAVPLALPGQIILGGPEIALSDLDANEGEPAAVLLSDGSSVFKRIGARLSAPLGHLLQLETIGGLGSSLVVATEAPEDGADLPVVVSARCVLGVLYEA